MVLTITQKSILEASSYNGANTNTFTHITLRTPGVYGYRVTSVSFNNVFTLERPGYSTLYYYTQSNDRYHEYAFKDIDGNLISAYTRLNTNASGNITVSYIPEEAYSMHIRVHIQSYSSQTYTSYLSVTGLSIESNGATILEFRNYSTTAWHILGADYYTMGAYPSTTLTNVRPMPVEQFFADNSSYNWKKSSDASYHNNIIPSITSAEACYIRIMTQVNALIPSNRIVGFGMVLFAEMPKIDVDQSYDAKRATLLPSQLQLDSCRQSITSEQISSDAERINVYLTSISNTDTSRKTQGEYNFDTDTSLKNWIAQEMITDSKRRTGLPASMISDTKRFAFKSLLLRSDTSRKLSKIMNFAYDTKRKTSKPLQFISDTLRIIRGNSKYNEAYNLNLQMKNTASLSTNVKTSNKETAQIKSNETIHIKI